MPKKKFPFFLELSNHAIQRLKDRVPIPENKFTKVAQKAFLSNLPLPETYINLKEYRGQNGIYRYYFGFTWIFYRPKKLPNKLILITVYKT